MVVGAWAVTGKTVVVASEVVVVVVVLVVRNLFLALISSIISFTDFIFGRLRSNGMGGSVVSSLLSVVVTGTEKAAIF